MNIQTPRLEISPITDCDRPEDFLSVFNSNPAFIEASESGSGRSCYDESDVALYLYQETTRENSTCLAIRARMVEEWLESVAIFPDHLEVTVKGAPRLNVTLEEAGLGPGWWQFGGVGGGT